MVLQGSIMHMGEIVTSLHVRAINGRSTRGILAVGGMNFPCAMGRSGRLHLKREGDGGSPVGTWGLTTVYYRGDRIPRPLTRLPLLRLHPGWGWCERVGDRNYNRRVNLPYAAAHEDLCRDDPLYDIVVATTHNERPRVQGLGSAIFFHLARPDFEPTAGCIAVTLPAMQAILRHCGRHTMLRIAAPGTA